LREIQSRRTYGNIEKELSRYKGILKVLECLKSEAEKQVESSQAALERQGKVVLRLNTKKNALHKKAFGTVPRRINKPTLNNVKSRRVPGLATSLRGIIKAKTLPYSKVKSPNTVQLTNALSSMIMCTHRQGQNKSCVVAAILNLLGAVIGLHEFRVAMSTLAEPLTAKVGSDAHGFSVPYVIEHLNQVVQDSKKVFAIDQNGTSFQLKFTVNLIETITGKDAVTAFAKSDRARKALFLIRTKTSELGHCFAAQGNKCPYIFDVIPSSLNDPTVVSAEITTDVWSVEIQNIELTPIAGGPSILVPSYPAPVLRCDAK